MRRSAAACLVPFLLVALVGCEEPQQKEDLQEAEAQTATMEPDYYVSDPAAQVSAGTYQTETHAAEPSYGSGTTGATGRTHLVGKGDTLYSLARQYYNDQRRWKDIYEANSDLIRDPNMIFVGQELVIP